MWNYTSPESKCTADLAAKEGQTKSWKRGSVTPYRNSGNLAAQSSFHPPPRSHGSSDKTRWQGNRAETRSRGRRPRRNQRDHYRVPPRSQCACPHASTCFESCSALRTNSCTAYLPPSLLIDSTPLHSITTPRLRRPSYHFTSRTKDRLSHLSSASLLFYPSTECQMLTHDDGGGEIGDRSPLARSVQSVVSHPENIELSSPEAAGRANTSLPRDKKHSGGREPERH